MTDQKTVDFLRRILAGWLERLNQMDQPSARAKRQRWFQREFHLPPLVVGITTTIILYLVLVWNLSGSLRQALILAGFVIIIMLLFSIYLHRDHPTLVKSDDAMALLAVIFFTTLIWIKLVSVLATRFPWLPPEATPVTIAALLTALLLDAHLAVVFSFAVAIIFGIINGFSLPLVLVASLGGTTMVAAGRDARSTNQVARAGVAVGLVQGLVVLFLASLMNYSRWETTLSVIWSVGSGMIAAAFSLGVLPYLESFFSRISNLRLVELAAINHPLLRRMSIEAPGTYHHSLIVASMAEDAANAIGANSLLCRVGAYFHDIGKMVKPEYFIENQGTFGNPHDQVAPSLSKLVIVSHVKEGVALAREYKLDPIVLDFIPQHHGTSQIEFFYLKALRAEKEEADENPEDVNEETYRYPGPRPQSKETGIVMLADSVEASSRTLEEPNHQRYKDLVNKIINKKLSDGQLSDTPLTLRDLHTIAERFTATLTSIHHARIPYPEPEGDKKGTGDRDSLFS